jgi:tetratricopeptide (TPR) repeat protein
MTRNGPASIPSLEDLRGLLRDARPEARDLLAAGVRARRDERGGHADWARLCEEAGETALALSEYQLALRDDPDDVVALGRLALLYEERGEVERALECAERRMQLLPSHPEAAAALVDLLTATGRLERARAVLAGATLPEETRAALAARILATARLDQDDGAPDEAPVEEFTDGDAVRFAHLFAGRENVYARQWVGPGGEGGYSPVREPFTVQVARNHLLGSITVGTYLLRLDDTVTFFALDLDLTKRAIARARGSVAEARRLKDLVARAARRLQEALAAVGIPALLEDSGYKGHHLWAFLEQPEPARVVRQFGELFVRACAPAAPELALEFFPKQDRAEGSVGNLIKLPLGIHRRSGRRSRLLRADGSPERDPHGTLQRHPRVSRATLHAAIIALKTRSAGTAPSTGLEGGPTEDEGSCAVDPGAFLPAPPAWTSADFDTHPEIATILRHCPVLDALRLKVERHRRLTHEERVVLQHTLGHSSAGVLAVNFLFDACADVPPGARLQSPLAGNPISCPKIRKRIPHVTAGVPCNCLFDFAPGRYPTPRLHLLRPGIPLAPATPMAEARWDPADRVRTLRALRVRQREIETELGRVEADLVAYLERSGVCAIPLDDGCLRLVQAEGQVPALVWEPQSRHDPAPPATA